MKESNQLHAVCLDTYPPIFYMNETSRLIIKTATAINAKSELNQIAYSIDAGFHVFLFTPRSNEEAAYGTFSQLPGVDKVIRTRIGREGVKLL